AIQWRADGDPADGRGDVISRHGLNKYRRQPDSRSVRRFIGDALDELEELRRVDDRVRNPGALDQGFLSVLRPEVGTVEYALRSHYGQRDVMLHAGCCRVLEKVAGGRGEERHDGCVFERRRVRDVDDDRRALKNFSQSLAREGVDARVWRCWHRFMAVCTQFGHELRSDESSAADDDEFHVDVLSESFTDGAA